MKLLTFLGNWMVSLGALLLAFGAAGGPLARPSFAYLCLGVGLFAHAVLALRQRSLWRLVKAAFSAGLVGAISGAVLAMLLRAMAAQSWGAVALLLAGSALAAGASFWYTKRRR